MQIKDLSQELINLKMKDEMMTIAILKCSIYIEFAYTRKSYIFGDDLSDHNYS